MLKPLIYIKDELYKHPVIIVICMRLVLWGTTALIIMALFSGNNVHVKAVP